MKRKASPSRIPQRHRTPKEKAKILEAQRRSGHSLLAFARDRRLCYATLLRWKKTLGFKSGPTTVEKAPGFVPVQLESEPRCADYYTLSLTSGGSLRIPSGFEPESLRRLLGVLEARS